MHSGLQTYRDGGPGVLRPVAIQLGGELFQGFNSSGVKSKESGLSNFKALNTRIENAFGGVWSEEADHKPQRPRVSESFIC